MSTILAIDLGSREARAVFGETLPEGKVRITAVEILPLPEDTGPRRSSNGATGAAEGAANSDGPAIRDTSSHTLTPPADGAPPTNAPPPGTDQPLVLDAENLSHSATDEPAPGPFADVEVDSVLALLPTDKVLYSTQEYPFDDPKKLEQIAPVQLQDLVPFEVDDFVVDSLVVGRRNGDYRVLSSIAPQSSVRETLQTLQRLGADPKLITTRASSLVPLLNSLLGVDADGAQATGAQTGLLVGVLQIEQELASLLVIHGSEPLLLRDLRWSLGGETELFRTVTCSIVRAERESGAALSRLYVLAAPPFVERAAQQIPRRVTPLDVSRFVLNGTARPLDLDQFAWSLGLLASELVKTKRSPRVLVDFRQGSFAYRRLLKQIRAALDQELFYIFAAIFFGLLWIGGELYSSHAELDRVERRIQSLVTSAMPGESVPHRGELTYITTKLSDLEEQLRSMGSLSSLSPLDSLRELVLALGSGVDVTFDSVSIGSSKLTLKGSVGDNQSVATLSTKLKERKDRFCAVQVDSKGKQTGSRVGVTVEIQLCE